MSESIELYSFAPFDRCSRVRWVANELGIAITEHRLNVRAGEHRSPEYRAINPTGLVPTMVRDGVPQFDSGAICLHLADTHPQAALSWSRRRLRAPDGRARRHHRHGLPRA